MTSEILGINRPALIHLIQYNKVYIVCLTQRMKCSNIMSCLMPTLIKCIFDQNYYLSLLFPVQISNVCGVHAIRASEVIGMLERSLLISSKIDKFLCPV